MGSLTLRPGDISLAELRRIARGNDSIALASLGRLSPPIANYRHQATLFVGRPDGKNGAI